MRACKKCGLSLGQLATFCPVCGTVADPEPVQPAIAPEPVAPAPAPEPEPEPIAQAPEPEPTTPEPEPEQEPEAPSPGPEPDVPSHAPEPEAPAPASEPELEPPVTEPEPPVAHTAAELEVEARECEKSDPARAVALYRRAVVDHLEASDDPLADRSAARDVQRLFDRLSLVLKRSGLPDESLEEIETAAYLGLVDDETCGTKAQREALAKRRDALRRAGARSTPSKAS